MSNNIAHGELAIKSEGMEDTFKDIAVYSTLAMILFRKEQEKNQELTDAEIDKALIEKGKGKEFELPKFEDPPKWDLPVSPSLFPVDDKHNGDDTTQELTEAERGKDAENDEDKFWAEEIKKREEFAREAVMKWRENGAIS